MYAIVWEYEVFPAFQKPFELLYGPEGEWVKLFQQAKGFIGTQLIHDEENPNRYLTVDQWASKAEYQDFIHQHRVAYDALDKHGSGLTQHEKRLGGFDMVLGEVTV